MPIDANKKKKRHKEKRKEIFFQIFGHSIFGFLFSWPLGGCEKGNETLTRRIYRKGVGGFEQARKPDPLSRRFHFIPIDRTVGKQGFSEGKKKSQGRRRTMLVPLLPFFFYFFVNQSPNLDHQALVHLCGISIIVKDGRKESGSPSYQPVNIPV